MNKTLKYLIFLVVCALPVAIARLLSGGDNVALNRIFTTLYYFTPAIAVLILERGGIKETFKKYKVGFKSINARRSLIYVLGAAFLFPLLYLLLLYGAGSLSLTEPFGQTAFGGGENILFGIDLPAGPTARFLIFYLFDVLWALAAGLTFNMLFSLGGEIGWRGFLGQNLTANFFTRNILTGLIWGTWALPMLLMNGVVDGSASGAIALMYAEFVVVSFLLDIVFRDSGSLFVPAAVRGILISFSLHFYASGGSPVSGFSWVEGAIRVLSLILLTLVFYIIARRTLCRALTP